MSNITNNLGDSRIAAIYSSQDGVEQAKAIILRKLGLPESKVKIIRPSDEQTSRKLEGKSQPIGKKMLNLHFVYGFYGLLVGMGLAFLLVEFGPDFTTQNPFFTYIALISPGLFIGLFIAGLLSLKPQRDRLNQDVVAHKNNNDWTLVIDTTQTQYSKEDVVSEIEHTRAITIHQ